MPYSYENSKGQKYYLHGKTVTLQGGGSRRSTSSPGSPSPGRPSTVSPRATWWWRTSVPACPSSSGNRRQAGLQGPRHQGYDGS